MTGTIERRVADRYVLTEVLGRGGMGVVWRAHDTLLQRTVAVKEIEFPVAPGVQSLDIVKERAMREARNAAALSHQNVIAVYDTVHEEGRAYIVMEFVAAPTLATLIERDGPMTPGEAATIALDILEALEVAHAAGIVHRDVKPGNVMVPASGHAKLADFGIATVVDDPKLTSTGMVLGSPQFMAPEQANGSRSGRETDIWALGATLYFMVEGVGPFDKGEAIPTLAAVVHDAPRPPRRAGPLEPLLVHLLAKDPHTRPATRQIRAALEDVIGAKLAPPAMEPAGAPEPTPAAPEPMRPAAVGDRTEDRRLRPRMVALIAALSVVAGGALWLAARPAPEEAPRDPTSNGGRNERPASAAVPTNWVEYRDPDTGYRIAHPPGWSVVPLGDTRTDIRHPSNGTYLRVDWTDAPGDDPVAAWESLSDAFAASHDNYSEMRIDATEYDGYEAAIWEFTYSEGGADLHAIDLGFVTGDYGFALNFQTRAENWIGSQNTFERFQNSFEPPG